jgi:hypothetical protein
MQYLIMVALGTSQKSAATLIEQAAATRDLAQRARRLADTMTQQTERERLLRHAQSLDEEAKKLDAEAMNVRETGRNS